MRDFTSFIALGTVIAVAGCGDVDAAADLDGSGAADPGHTLDRASALRRGGSPAQAGPTVAAFRRAFAANGYRLEAVRAGAPVPRLFAERLPRDLGRLDSIDRRQKVFIATLLPIVLEVNSRIRLERSRLLAVVQRTEEGGMVDDLDRSRLSRLADRYGTRNPEELLRRIDEIPPSLAIAQAAVETGWGTSRFAQRGNALFGQRAEAGEGEGFMPSGYATDPGFRVAAFPNLTAAIETYALNLNTNEAYRAFRGRRARGRATQAALDGYSLAGTLEQYSAKGWKYVTILRAVIRDNRLERLDRARLEALDDTIAQLPAD